MRKLLVLMALAVAAAVATPQLASAASMDQVRGKATSSVSRFEISVNARSGPSGESPRGVFSFDFAPDTFGIDRHVRVTCMVVSGNTAIVGGLDQTGREMFLRVVDNGDTQDLVSLIFANDDGPAPDQNRCAFILSGDPAYTVVDGGLTVEDALPAP